MQIPPSAGSRLPPDGAIQRGSVDPLEALRAMGVQVFDNEGTSDFGWDMMAGYDSVKRDLEETVVLAVQHPEIFDAIAKKTRVRFERNRRKAVLLDGPPGTGILVPSTACCYLS